MQSVIHLKSNTYEMFQPVFAVQNDTGRTLKMIVDDVTYTNSDTGKLYFMRSDGSYYNVSTTFSSGDNSFTADITQALTQSGRTDCQLKVTDSGDDVVSTFSFPILVQSDVDGVQTEQLGVTPEELVEAAQQLTLSDNDVKLALLQIAEKTAYIDANGQDYYDALEDALYPPVRATSVTLNKNSLGFTGVGGTDTLVATVSPNNVEDDTVYWGSSDKSVAVVSDGIVTATGLGSCTITATCNTKHADCSVTVATVTVSSISASYTQTGVIYDDDTLDDILTAGTLVVTATWSDSTQTTVSNTDVALSGSLTAGTSTITASYGGKSDTFTVTVTANDILYELASQTVLTGSNYINTDVKPFESTGNNVTIYYEILWTENTQPGNARIFYTGATDFGIYYQSGANYRFAIKAENGVIDGSNTLFALSSVDKTKRIRTVVTQSLANQNLKVFASYYDTGGNLQTVTRTCDQTNTGALITSQPIMIGAYNSSNQYSQTWKGTVNEFVIKSSAMSDADATAYITGD